MEKPEERMLLEYGCGRALIGKVRSGEFSVVDEDKHRFVRVQVIADLQTPELGYLIPRTVMHLQLIADLIEERKELWREIERREIARRESEDKDFDQDSQSSEDAILFERLLDLCQKISEVRQGDQ